MTLPLYTVDATPEALTPFPHTAPVTTLVRVEAKNSKQERRVCPECGGSYSVYFGMCQENGCEYNHQSDERELPHRLQQECTACGIPLLKGKHACTCFVQRDDDETNEYPALEPRPATLLTDGGRHIPRVVDEAGVPYPPELQPITVDDLEFHPAKQCIFAMCVEPATNGLFCEKHNPKKS